MLKDKYRYHVVTKKIAYGGTLSSYQWKCIKQGFITLIKGLSWRVGNGRKVLFWKDIWLHESNVKDCILDNMNINLNLKVTDAIHEGLWQLTDLNSHIPMDLRHDIISMVVFVDSNIEDDLIWSLSYGGNFSVSLFMAF